MKGAFDSISVRAHRVFSEHSHGCSSALRCAHISSGFTTEKYNPFCQFDPFILSMFKIKEVCFFDILFHQKNIVWPSFVFRRQCSALLAQKASVLAF